VNPAYTSQTCYSCHRIGRRESQAELRCPHDDCHVSTFQAGWYSPCVGSLAVVGRSPTAGGSFDPAPFTARRMSLSPNSLRSERKPLSRDTASRNEPRTRLRTPRYCFRNSNRLGTKGSRTTTRNRSPGFERSPARSSHRTGGPVRFSPSPGRGQIPRPATRSHAPPCSVKRHSAVFGQETPPSETTTAVVTKLVLLVIGSIPPPADAIRR